MRKKKPIEIDQLCDTTTKADSDRPAVAMAGWHARVSLRIAIVEQKQHSIENYERQIESTVAAAAECKEPNKKR